MFNKLKSFKLVIFLSIFCIGLCIFTFLSFINSKSLSFLNGNLQILLILDVVLLSTFLFIIFRKSINLYLATKKKKLVLKQAYVTYRYLHYLLLFHLFLSQFFLYSFLTMVSKIFLILKLKKL